MMSFHNLKSRLGALFRNRHTPQPEIRHAQDTRCDQRIAVHGLRAEISDGLRSYCGLVINISRSGVCLRDVTDRLSPSRALLSIAIHAGSGSYRLVVRPRWTKLQENRAKTIGAEIASSPDSWGEFVLSYRENKKGYSQRL